MITLHYATPGSGMSLAAGNGLQAYRAAQRWSWGWKVQHASACRKNTGWYAAMNRAYKPAA